MANQNPVEAGPSLQLSVAEKKKIKLTQKATADFGLLNSTHVGTTFTYVYIAAKSQRTGSES